MAQALSDEVQEERESFAYIFPADDPTYNAAFPAENEVILSVNLHKRNSKGESTILHASLPDCYPSSPPSLTLSSNTLSEKEQRTILRELREIAEKAAQESIVVLYTLITELRVLGEKVLKSRPIKRFKQNIIQKTFTSDHSDINKQKPSPQPPHVAPAQQKYQRNWGIGPIFPILKAQSAKLHAGIPDDIAILISRYTFTESIRVSRVGFLNGNYEIVDFYGSCPCYKLVVCTNLEVYIYKKSGAWCFGKCIGDDQVYNYLATWNNTPCEPSDQRYWLKAYNGTTAYEWSIQLAQNFILDKRIKVEDSTGSWKKKSAKRTGPRRRRFRERGKLDMIKHRTYEKMLHPEKYRLY